ncbi:methyltransferase domain-containing protein [Streptomyces sp. NPDC048428]|uniref:class I SAM-dependent methyltransferase n=1 Tax=Streptomyces sp. NPDC048428 TaxID=3154503 RepID=UPI00342EF12A
MQSGYERTEAERRAICGEANVLASLYERVTFDEVHRQVLHLMPTNPVRALDIGAGTGRDAAALSIRGHTVVAIEPAADLRAVGQRIHATHNIAWVDDNLPELRNLGRPCRRFQLVLLTAVWMFLPEAQRHTAAIRLDELLEDGGRLGMVLRGGPIAADRGMYTVSAAETISLLTSLGLRLIHQSQQSDSLGRKGVFWNNLFFEKPSAPEATGDTSQAGELPAGRNRGQPSR